MKKINVIWVIALFKVGISASQKALYPEIFSSVFEREYVVNAAAIESENRVLLSTSIWQFMGSSTDIQSFDFNFGYNFIQAKRIQNIRLKLNSMNEGPYISSKNLLANYALALQLNKTQTLNFGVDFGAFARAYTAPSSGTSGKSVSPNANLGLEYSTKNASISFHANQMFNSQGKPLQSAFVLKRYFSVLFNQKIKLNNGYKLKINHFGRLVDSRYQELSNVSIELPKIASVGLSHRSVGELVFSTILNFKFEKGNLNTGFYLNLPYSTRISSQSNSVEWIVTYQF